MSPKMKEYLRKLGYEYDPDLLNAGIPNMRLDDPSVQRSRSPGNFGRHTPEAARKGKKSAQRSSFFDSDGEEHFDEDDEDHDSANGDLQQNRSFTHNDNRVITTNINSNNLHTENVVDSYNDNSTRTDIRKAAR